MLLQSFLSVFHPPAECLQFSLRIQGDEKTFPSLIILCSTVISLDRLCSQGSLEICPLPIPSILYWEVNKYVAVNFLFQLIFVFPLFLGMVMYANEFETKEKQKLTEIKKKLQQIHNHHMYINQAQSQSGLGRNWKQV